MRQALYTLTKNGKVWGNNLFKSYLVAKHEAKAMEMWDKKFMHQGAKYEVVKIAEWYDDHYEIYFEREIIND